MEKIKIMINDDLKECDLLYTFKSDKTNNNYLICTDNTYDNDKLNVYSFIYYPDNREKGLEKISKDEEWEEVEQFLSLTEVCIDD